MDAARKVKRKPKEIVVICVCGLAGSGKSTAAKRLAEKYGFRYYSGGDALMALALKKGYKALNGGWWESKEGLRFLGQRGKDQAFDKSVDKELLRQARRGNVILDSWTMPWLLKGGFKIWLEASQEKRAERIANRDRMSEKEALQAMMKKERETRIIYRKLYHFTLGEDFEPFDLILDTEELDAEEVFQTLCMVLERIPLA
jgi:cytidylate kinase